MAETTGGDEATATTGSKPPVLRIVNADATPEEVAAVVAVFASLGGSAAPASRRPPAWAAPHRLVRRTLPHGPGGWRASTLPH